MLKEQGIAGTDRTRTTSWRPVFIVGYPRSGTTWMIYLLAQHPAVVGCHQSGLFHVLRPLEQWWTNAGGFGKEIIGGAKTDGAFEEQSVAQSLTEQDFTEVTRNLAERVFERMAGGHPETQIIADQTPENLVFASTIRKIFPDAMFLHMMRDPRAIYSSLSSATKTWAKHNTFFDSPAHITRKWCAYEEAGNELEQSCTNYKRVRYEDIRADPQAHLRQIYQWLGLPADEDFCKAAVEACSIDNMRKNAKAPKGFYRKGSASGWRDEVSNSALKTIEFIARDAMARQGYECLTPVRQRRPLRLWSFDQLAATLQWARGRVSKPMKRRLKQMGN